MSGDVQPRKRKDKKRKKDELGLEEPRGTAAALGEGDVFMHSQHDHGTGGHWCAKIIFFSLLAILITLIGLIILENRGLSELEANSVQTQYSGVLEGWLEDAPEDDHHDEHTLELTHHDDDSHDDVDHVGDEDHDGDHDDEDDHAEEDDDDEHGDDEDDERDDEDDEHDDEDNDAHSEEDDDVDDEQYDDDEHDDDDDEQRKKDDEVAQSDEDENDNQEDDGNESENDDGSVQNYEDDDEHEEEKEDEEIEVEKLEKELANAEPISVELPALPEDDDDEGDKDEGASNEKDEPEDEADDDNGIGEEEDEFLEADDADEPPIERITVPPGKPFMEVEEEESSEQPPDTLAEEEEYEKRQEELRKEEAEASHMWLKLSVGGALLLATHAVVRRATRERDASENEQHDSREETPATDRRMTLLPEQHSAPVRRVIEEVPQPVIERVVDKITPVIKSVPIRKQESEEEEEDEDKQLSEDEEIVVGKETDDKELYSDEDEPAEEIEEEEEEEEIIVPKKEPPKQSAPVVEKKPEPDSEEEIEDPDDVEIIGDEQLEEELEEEDDEEEISDVDDAELLTRLEAKYGRLPEPERPGQKHKDGGNSIDDVWPGEPSDAYWRQQLDSAERELRQGSWSAASERAGAAQLQQSARAKYIIAKALDAAAEANRDNRLLSRAIAAYLDLLKMNERLSDKKLLEVTSRTLDRIQFRGNYLNAEPVYRLLIRRFPNEPSYRNNLTVSFLMANRVDLAEDALKETLRRWPDDRIALAHYGFVLKTKHNQYEKAVEAFKKALEGDTGPANEARFYYHYGDSLILLGRPDEAHQVHKRGAKLGHFLSPVQRSLYNVPRLKGAPWWNIEGTPYLRLAKALEKSWKEILKEGVAAKALYEQEKEGLKERGEWSQLDLFVRGQEIPDRCKRAPVTCAIVKSEPAAAGCRRGQVKFSLMAAGTHVRAHVGPTNCRLRMHLGLSNTKDTYIRVDKEIRQWQTGKVLMFDDSFEHEVWHNGTAPRLVLIVDVWHPQLTSVERRTLPAI